ncbi:hypothetical protein CHL67_10345 [Prosthecochloris sp. GSB1]|uniref:hypothetical protein n=1 Tax=Prosthecochloris sp. GSB1 TaxID=281093 RepID=UPI000B8D05C4|nr:hypothetical protein [Prosthecochloris sp. GSB1]ASQ91257.1 hypothetical protein CHL67_10345 [Prosthecochloris sp. GSB1]
MSIARHACAIDRHSTTLAGIEYEPSVGFTLTECQTLRAGLEDLSGTGTSRFVKKLGTLLRKNAVETLTLCFHSPALFPLDTVVSPAISREALETHCRAEASRLLIHPERYRYDDLPYAPGSEGNPSQRRLLLYYPGNIPETLKKNLDPVCRIEGCSHYLKPMLLSAIASEKPFIILVLEPEYAALSAGSGMGLDYFRYWTIRQESDAEYFGIRELLLDRRHREYPVYVTGSLSTNGALIERIANGTGKNVSSYDPAKLFPVTSANRSSKRSRSTMEFNAIGAAMQEIFQKKNPAEAGPF